MTVGIAGQGLPYAVMLMQAAAFDVIGIFGFSKDFRATLDLQGEGAQACKCLSDGERHRRSPAANLQRSSVRAAIELSLSSV